MNMRKEIIDSIMWGIGVNVMGDLDIESEWHKSRFKSYLTFLKAYCKNPENKAKVEEYLNNEVYHDELWDDVVNGCGEYWRQEFGIYNLEHEMEGDEVEEAFKEFCKTIGCEATLNKDWY